MSCNPCCCLKLKDAAVTIGIWSTIYSIMQLGIFGWQMAAIKYEKDRAANTLLPNYNTYGRYDIPTYYESYWQSPEERYYTWLFVIQILCLISAFFLLFASIMMIYGVHTWSRYLLVPWMVTMCASILTSLAYCIMWWAGDVRDYWLMLTIVEMFGVFLNVYCFVVIIMFHRRMLAELEYYARRRKYDQFSQMAPQESPQHTIEQEIADRDENIVTRKEQMVPYRRPVASQFPYQHPPPPQTTQPQPADMGRFAYGPPQMPERQRTPMERFRQETLPSRPMEPVPTTLPRGDQVRSRSAMEQRSIPYDDFIDVPRQAERRASSYKQKKEHRPSRHCHHCLHFAEHCHCHRYSGRRRKTSCSSICTLSANGEYSTEEPTPRMQTEHRRSRRRRSGRRRSRRKGGERHWSDQDQESDLSEFAQTAPSERDYGNLSSLERQRRERIAHQWRRYPSVERRRQPQKNAAIQADAGELSGMESMGTLPRTASQQFLTPRGISIPQHIVIPPVASAATGTMDTQAERKYRINSEIVISYDHQRDQSPANPSPAVPPRRHFPPATYSPQSTGYINMSMGSTTPRGPTTPQIPKRIQREPISITSNV